MVNPLSSRSALYLMCLGDIVEALSATADSDKNRDNVVFFEKSQELSR